MGGWVGWLLGYGWMHKKNGSEGAVAGDVTF